MTIVKKPVIRQTHGGVFEKSQLRPVIVSIEPPNLIGFRLKGNKRKYYLTAEGAYLQAVKAFVAHEKAEKVKARKEKRKGKLTSK